MLSSLLGGLCSVFFGVSVVWLGGAGCRGNTGARVVGVGVVIVQGGLIGRLAAGLGVGVVARVTRELVTLASRCIVSRSFSTFSRCVR